MRARKTHPLNQSPLYKLNSRGKLAKLLNVTSAELRNLESGVDQYIQFKSPKKDGTGFREVENPKRDLKKVQARLARILAAIDPPDFLFCPVKRRCYVTNAAAHRRNRVVQCLDIKKFFPSTPQRRVFWFFNEVMSCGRDISGLLAKLACFQGHLPTGSPLSPIMAYFSFYDLWSEIDEFCKARSYTFTVYIDDVTISGAKVPKFDVWKVRRMMHKRGLVAHKMKTYIDTPSEITGVIVKNGKLVAPFRQHRKKFEAKVLLNKANEEDRGPLLGQVSGIEGQIRQIAAKN